MNKPVTTCRMVAAVILAIGFNVAAQAQRGTAPRARAATHRTGYSGPRTPDRKPDLNGIWQVLSTAHWNLEAHSATEGVPAGFSVVEGGAIPYQPGVLAKRNENFIVNGAHPFISERELRENPAQRLASNYFFVFNKYLPPGEQPVNENDTKESASRRAHTGFVDAEVRSRGRSPGLDRCLVAARLDDRWSQLLSSQSPESALQRSAPRLHHSPFLVGGRNDEGCQIHNHQDADARHIGG